MSSICQFVCLLVCLSEFYSPKTDCYDFDSNKTVSRNCHQLTPTIHKVLGSNSFISTGWASAALIPKTRRPPTNLTLRARLWTRNAPLPVNSNNNNNQRTLVSVVVTDKDKENNEDENDGIELETTIVATSIPMTKKMGTTTTKTTISSVVLAV